MTVILTAIDTVKSLYKNAVFQTLEPYSSVDSTNE